MSSTDIVMIGKLKDAEGNLIDVEAELTRDQFEVMISPKVKESIELVKTAIAEAHLTMDQIDHVLMVGGSSTIPMIRRALSDLFGEKKVLMNMDPMRCVAYGAGILSARLGDSIECPKCQTINPGSSAVCVNEACKEPLDGNIIYDVTGMHYGIQTEGDVFKVIIEKGSPYPTPEPIVKTFRTPISNMRRIKVPVYAGSHEIASKNEKQITVWLELPENVPADTPVDVAFKLDSDGILENVRVSLKDGSGREIEVYPDRGDTKRAQVENKMEEIKKKWDEKRSDADEEINKNLDVIYGKAIKAANSNNIEAAEKRIHEMEKEVGKIGGETGPEWKQKATGIMGYANFLLEQYGWLLDPQQSYKIKGLVDELKDAMEKDDEQLGLKKWDELYKETDAIPEIVRLLMIIVNGIMRAHASNRLVEADKLRNLLREIEDAIKKNNADVVRTKIDEAMAILVEMLGASARDISSGPINVELLK
jgi:molecular chaperone DnaK (HSP70)